jgi:hypothetical protein
MSSSQHPTIRALGEMRFNNALVEHRRTTGPCSEPDHTTCSVQTGGGELTRKQRTAPALVLETTLVEPPPPYITPRQVPMHLAGLSRRADVRARAVERELAKPGTPSVCRTTAFAVSYESERPINSNHSLTFR